MFRLGSSRSLVFDLYTPTFTSIFGTFLRGKNHRHLIIPDLGGNYAMLIVCLSVFLSVSRITQNKGVDGSLSIDHRTDWLDFEHPARSRS